MRTKNWAIGILLAVGFLMVMAGPALAFGTKEVDTEKTAVGFQREVAKGGYQVVRTDELMGGVKQKKDMLIVDTMPFEASYKKQHIPGAVQFELPVEEMASLDSKTEEALVKLLGPDKNRTLVFYCGFTKCGRSHNGAMWAVKLGYKSVYRCPGGIKAWSEAGYPVEKSK